MSTTAEQRAERLAVIRSAPAGMIPADAQRMLDERKAINLVAAKIAGMSWGQALDLETRRTLAEYCRARGIDAATEIYILGNRVYRNAEYFINRAQPFIRAGVLAVDYEYVNHDKRLDTLAKSSDADAARKAHLEIGRRMALRIEFNIPEGAQSAVIAVVRFPKHDTAFRAAKWCGNGVRKNDPVGEGNPEATAVTRALRKVLKMAVGYEPTLQPAFGETEAEGEAIAEIEAVVHDSRAEQKALTAEVRANEVKALRNVPATEYDPESGTASLGRLSPDAIAEIASRPDPYEVPPTPARVTDPDDPNFADTFPDDEQELALGDTRPSGRTDALRDGH